MGTDVATAQKSAVPALASTPALDLGQEDIALPRLYIGQFMSEHVKQKVIDAGDLYIALGKDDMDATKVAAEGEKVRIHVLALRRGKSANIDGELESFRYDDPEAPPDAYTTYNYVVAIPGVQDDLPVKFLLKRTGSAAAKKINLALLQGAGAPPYEIAFDVWTEPRKNAKGDYWVPGVSVVKAKDADVKVAEALNAFVPQNVEAEESAGGAAEQPGI